MRISKKVIALLSIAALYLLLRYWGVTEYLTFEQLQAHRHALQIFVEQHYWFAVLVYLAFYVLAIALSFPSASLITLTGGFLFGVWVGTCLSVIGATIGAIIAFVLVRYLFAESMQSQYTKQMQQFTKAIKEYGISFLLFVRLVAIFPFFLINIVAALTPVPVGMFIWTTLVGIIPGTLVYSFAGTQLRTLESARDILSPSIIGIFLVLGLLALLPVLIKRTKK